MQPGKPRCSITSNLPRLSPKLYRADHEVRSRLLPQGGDGAGEAQVQRHIQAANVDAQLHGVGGRHAPQLPLQQRPLNLPPLLRIDDIAGLDVSSLQMPPCPTAPPAAAPALSPEAPVQRGAANLGTFFFIDSNQRCTTSILQQRLLYLPLLLRPKLKVHKI